MPIGKLPLKSKNCRHVARRYILPAISNPMAKMHEVYGVHRSLPVFRSAFTSQGAVEEFQVESV